MTTRDLFLAVLVGLYVIDLWWLVPRRAFVFRGYGLRLRWSAASLSGFALGSGLALSRFGELPFGLAFASDFPALRQGRIRRWPLFAAIAGVPSERSVDGALGLDGTRLRDRGGVVLRYSSANAAQLAHREGRDRLKSDPEAVRALVGRFSRATIALRLACTCLFVFCFGALPAVLYGAFEVQWWALLAGYGGLVLSIQAGFFALHRRFYRERVAERWAKTAVMLVSPAEAMVASYTLGRGLLAGQHPLAVAKGLCSEAEFQRLSAELVRGALVAHPDEQDALRAVLTKLQADPATLIAAPERDGASAAYCPRCLAQFEEKLAMCPDCEDVALKHF
ncbi:MAG: hypothetical protein AAF654_08555 [Myxococcota bacterium]